MTSELRKDPISGRWVIIAPERGKRPDEFGHTPPEKKVPFLASCPFCPGNEAKTPPEVFARRDPATRANQPGWSVRVVPNQFPALRRGPSPEARTNGLFSSLDGVGVHEVIIDSPAHNRELADLDPLQVQDVLRTCRDRIRSIESEAQYRYIQLFKNNGKEAGASLRHPHTQVIALPIVPKRVEEEVRTAERFFHGTGECLSCRMSREEMDLGERLIAVNPHFVAIAPFASAFPYEMRIQPLRHSPFFSDTREDEVPALADLLKGLFAALKSTLSDPPYNVVLHQAPSPSADRSSSAEVDQMGHWSLEIIPILTHVAGFEWGTDFYINPVPPETAAHFLKEKNGLP
jgi:UDPglucose--hexose-1-phosphate uridylyltransferase